MEEEMYDCQKKALFIQFIISIKLLTFDRMYIKELIIKRIFSFVSGLPIVSNVVLNRPPPPLLSAYAATFLPPWGGRIRGGPL